MKAQTLHSPEEKIRFLEQERDAALARVDLTEKMLAEVNRDPDGLVHEATGAERCPCESEERFRSMADLIPHMVWSARPDGFIDYINCRLLEYGGMTLEQAQGWSWIEAAS